MARRRKARAPVVTAADLRVAQREYAGEESCRSLTKRSIAVSSSRRAGVKKELMVHLRTRRQLRQVKGGTTKIGLVSIVDRSRSREQRSGGRAVPGHWEGDSCRGRRNTHIATLVERHTRFVMLIKLDGKDTPRSSRHLCAKCASSQRAAPLVTWDRALRWRAQAFTLATDVQVYFCDPRSPCSAAATRTPTGCCAVLPEGDGSLVFSQAYLNRIALRLNQRPRKTLGYDCPADRLRAVLQ